MEELLMKRVITYGTFDLLHYGHINLLSNMENPQKNHDL